MRESNMELCRFISILLIVMLHSGFQTLGVPTNLSQTSVPLLLMQAFCNVGVNAFILLTGFYSARLKTKSFVNLAYICFFYALVAICIGLLSNQPIQFSKVLFITKSNWFIPSYLCLLAVAPFINKACDNMTRKEFMGGGILIGVMLTWFGWLPALPDVSIGANNGCSVISFLYIYIIGRYIKLYGLPQWFVKHSAFIYVMSSILLATIAYCTLKYGQSYESRMNGIIQRINANNDPLMIISAMAFFSFFRSLKMKDSKIINYIAKSTLAVLLFHGSRQFAFFMMPHFRNLYDNYYGLKCAILWLLSVLAIGAIAVAIDQVRLLSFKLISPWLNRGAEKIVNSIDNQI